MSYPMVDLKSELSFDNIRVGVNGITRQTSGACIAWRALGDYLNSPDKLIEELAEALSYSKYIYTDDWKRYASPPTLYSLFPGLLNPDGKPSNWYFKGSDKKAHLTFLAQDPKGYAIIACTHYITYKEHKRLVREAVLDIETLVREQVQRGVSEGIAQAVADGTATLKEVQTEKQRLEEQLRQLDVAEQRIKAREELEERREQEKATRKASKTTCGFVYVVKQVGGEHYKIGRTVDPDDRLNTFNVKLPFPVEFEILLKCEDMYKLESELHARYVDKRTRGEWFSLNTDDLEAIRSIGR